MLRLFYAFMYICCAVQFQKLKGLSNLKAAHCETKNNSRAFKRCSRFKTHSSLKTMHHPHLALPVIIFIITTLLILGRRSLPHFEAVANMHHPSSLSAEGLNLCSLSLTFQARLLSFLTSFSDFNLLTACVCTSAHMSIEK